jgi:2-dehydro-3-deoxy-D-arabinonate dehydratase
MPSIKLYRTAGGVIAQSDAGTFAADTDWDELIRDPSAAQAIIRRGQKTALPDAADLLPPILSQEVWAAGVTYFRSRDARMDESRQAGGDDFYARVYEAERPELFFKAAAHRVVGPGQPVRIRRDSRWNVPEPELTLVISPVGRIVGYTIGNDMSSRDIEGENPLYLPQAKVYDGACALGPCVLISDEPPSPQTAIELQIKRGNAVIYTGQTTLSQMKRKHEQLVEFLYRETSFPKGCYLLTGTGVIPPADFTLQPGDRISITIEPIGTLCNTVL